MNLEEVLKTIDHVPDELYDELAEFLEHDADERVWVPNPGPQTDAYFSEADEVFYGGQAGGGKLLNVKEILPTPTGFVEMGRVRIGDTLFDAEGQPCRVIAVSEIRMSQDVYEVVFSDGSIIEADGGHLWHTFTERDRDQLRSCTDEWRERRKTRRPSRAVAESKKPWVSKTITDINKKREHSIKIPTGSAKTTEEIRKTLYTTRGAANHSIPVAKPLDTPYVNLPIEPYLLGLWLGDGISAAGRIGMLASDWEEILPHIEREITRVIHRDTKDGQRLPYTDYIFNNLRADLNSLGILGKGAKRIPAVYLRASIEQRKDLLRGLLDTDGHCSVSGAIELALSKRDLLEDVYELVCSLGIQATINTRELSKRNSKHADSHRIKFTAQFPAFKLPRKLKRQKLTGFRNTVLNRYIVDVKPAPPVMMRCIGVDSPTHLYLASRSMVPTHNTDLEIGLALTAHHRSLLLRRTNKEVNGLAERMAGVLNTRDGYNSQTGMWRLPDGRTVELGGCQLEEDKQKYKGNPHDLICVGPNTNILMHDGRYQKAYTVKVGDMVATLEGPRRVNKAFQVYDRESVALTVKTSEGVFTQVQSYSHKVLSRTGWVAPGIPTDGPSSICGIDTRLYRSLHKSFSNTSSTPWLISLAGGTENTQKCNPHRQQEYPHPYTKGVRLSCLPLNDLSYSVSPIGKMDLCDFEIDEVNHFITEGGIVNKNCFDEVSDFSESQYTFIIGWNRSTIPGQRCRIVSAGNPPTRPEGLWVLKRWAAWLDPQHPNPAQPGELRWYTTGANGDEIEVDGPGPHLINGQNTYARSRTFIPATLADNPDLIGTGYQASLDALPAELRAAYRDGNFGTALKDDPYQVIPTDWVTAAQQRWTPQAPLGIPMCAVGVDVAIAKDKFVIAVRHDGWYDKLVAVPGHEIEDPKKAAGRVIAVRRDMAHVIVDVGGGWGADCYAQLASNQIDATGYMGVKASHRKTSTGQFSFSNVRTEAFWNFREALDPSQPGGSQIMLPPDAELKADLCAPSYKVNGNHHGATLMVESKVDVCKRLGRSTDKGDAVIMAWWKGRRQANVQGGWEGGRRQSMPVVNRGRRHK